MLLWGNIAVLPIYKRNIKWKHNQQSEIKSELTPNCENIFYFIEIKSNQVKYIYMALFTIQIVSKLLHNINQDNITVFVYSWKKTIKIGRADQSYDGSFNLNTPTEQAKVNSGKEPKNSIKWPDGVLKLHQTQWRKKKKHGRTQAQSGASSPLAFMN